MRISIAKHTYNVSLRDNATVLDRSDGFELRDQDACSMIDTPDNRVTTGYIRIRGIRPKKVSRALGLP